MKRFLIHCTHNGESVTFPVTGSSTDECQEAMAVEMAAMGIDDPAAWAEEVETTNADD